MGTRRAFIKAFSQFCVLTSSNKSLKLRHMYFKCSLFCIHDDMTSILSSDCILTVILERFLNVAVLNFSSGALQLCNQPFFTLQA